jgi:mycothiol-dependent nitroreductase-like protein
MDASFFFDPICPWTWMSSRWLVDATTQLGHRIVWRTFSLAMVNEGQEVPRALLEIYPDFHARQALTAQVMRMIEALRAAGRNEDIGDLYREWGMRYHVRKETPDQGLLAAVARAAGVEAVLGSADDASLDQAVRESLDEALRAAGPDVGSPVLLLDGNERGGFGPIVSPPPRGDDALRLWDAVVALHSLTTFLELKRGRTAPPAITD